MGSKKEEERNEKIIRGLMKLPPNRRCMNCNSMGPQYVCTNFWSFVCIACSGIHREFTHRVKSVSMAKFTSQEVESLQNGGNQRAREIYLKNWDLQRQRLPDSSNVDKIRQFIKDVYVDKKFAAGQTSEKPPRDIQNRGIREDDTRRASSYHSFSQSPPYDYQYEDRKYGKQVGALTRKPGSDRGRYEGKTSSFVYSPGRGSERIFDDGFSVEGSVSRVSDYSASSGGDLFRSGTQSPNFQKDRDGFGSPPFAISRANSIAVDSFPQRSRSLGSFGSIDGNFASFDSGPEQVPETASSVAPIDLFQLPEAPLPASSTKAIEPAKAFTPLDLFAASNEKLPSAPSNEGWATFDMPQSTAPTSRNDDISPVTLPSSDSRPALGDLDLFLPIDAMQWPSAPQDFSFHSDQPTSNPADTQIWNAFEDSFGQQTFDGLKPESDVLAGSDTASSTAIQNSSLGQSSDLEHFDWGVTHDPPPFPLRKTEETCVERKSSNPFDLPYDSQLEDNDMFMDMTSLHTALPNDHLSSSFIADVSQPWFSENTALPQAPSPQISNVAAQGSLAAGNPFA